MVAYTMMGGLLAVAYTDVIQMVIMIVAVGLLLPAFILSDIGAAAAALVAALMLPGLLRGPDTTIVPQNVGTQAESRLSTLQTLMSESRDLESTLRALPEAPVVQRASTLATITDLEDRIAAIDYQLNDPSIDLSDEDRELFWRERVRLMKSLLQLRYAQAQRAAF